MDVSLDGTVDITTRTLVESMIREDDTIDAGELYEVANALGMNDQQVRLCIKRLAAEGHLTQEGRGRKAVLHAADKIRSSIEPDLEFVRFMYDQDHGRAPWDGVWHLAAFAIPESSRQARDAMRDAILYLGGAPIQGALYVSANEWEPRIRSTAEQLGVSEYITMLTTTDLQVGGRTTPRGLAEHLWPLRQLEAGHRRLLDAAQRLRPAIVGASHTAHLAIAMELAVEFTRAMEPDPLLPPELLPQPWVGSIARSEVADCWADLRRKKDTDSIRLFHLYSDVIRTITSANTTRKP